MVFNQTEKQERSYLQQIINRLKQIISHTDVSVKDHVDTLAEYKDYLWSSKDIDPHEIRSMRESILNHFALRRCSRTGRFPDDCCYVPQHLYR